MKNIFYSIILFTFASIFTSCTDDDRTPIILDDKTSVEGTLTFDDQFFAPGAAANFTVSIASSYQKHVRVTVSATSQENIIEYSQVILNPGETIATGIIEMPAYTLGGSNGTYETSKVGFVTARIEGINIVDEIVTEVEGEDDEITYEISDEDNIKISSNEIAVDYITRLLDADDEGFGFLLDWANPTVNDLDIQLIDEAFTFVAAGSATFDRFEDALIENSEADGNYVFYLRIYNLPNPTVDDIPYTLHMVQPNGGRITYEGVLPAGSASEGARIPVAILAKAGSDYTFTAL
ncbi:hypothetical protein [Tenacibaculum sp. M341]|uniref:hypothetical protein n=1 Tax=Tenacibaculum sp. M341 TaxID=2530339 RepID=UPI001046751B|nr:hypothetical protein [Tenacibaculum sp. M341]TCI92540.1 hypothetical protein EYW44_06475 [Tenacibaculum sp. M341]